MPASLLTVEPLTASGIAHIFDNLPGQGLVGWYRANDIVGVSSGASLASWPNSSLDPAALSAATQPSAASQPVYRSSNASFNGMATVEFNASQHLFTSALTTKPTKFAVFSVSYFSTAVNTITAVGSGDATTLNRLQILSANSSWAINVGVASGITNSAKTAAQAQVVYALFNGSNSSMIVVGPGVVSSVLSTSASVLSNTDIGGMNLTLGWRGNISETLLYNRDLTVSEVSNVLSYLTTRYNIL